MIFLRRFMKRLIFVPIFFIFTLTGKAQLEVGVFAGTSFYMGDLNPSTPFLNASAGFGVLGRYNLNSRWTVKLNGYQGILIGDDASSNFLAERSLKFKSSVKEFGGVIEFNFLPYFTGSVKNFFTPYIFGGFAIFYNRPKVNNTELRFYGTEGQDYPAYLEGEVRQKYSFYNFGIPFGMGIKYSFSKRIAATLEWGMRKTFTDYLDDVSTTYYLPADEIEPGDELFSYLRYSDPNMDHQPLMQRGNSKTKDWYSFAGLTLTYNINLRNRNKCSEFEQRY